MVAPRGGGGARPRPRTSGTTTRVPPPADGTLQPGLVLGERYALREALGRGGMGVVWLAHDLKLRVDVALKAVRPDQQASDRRRERLRAEVRAAREVLSPNVCRVFDLVVEGDRELVSMEYVDGATLAALLEERAPLDLGEARDLAAQLLAGLEAVHRAGLVHRDVKPENVMVTPAGRVVLMDLGIAQRVEDPSGTVVGTPAYMAPEQSEGRELDARADVFAAGVTLAEMTAPGGSETRQALFAGLRSDPPRVPEGPWSGVIRKAVSRHARDRYASARELSRALDGVTLRVAGEDERRPYPGLLAFTEAEAEHFFGREAEVESLLRKLAPAPRLLAIAGPSGAGKSSFVRAGLIPALPEGWRAAVLHPGARPFAALATALVPELSGDEEAMGDLVRMEEPEAAVSALRRWRRRHARALLVLDQFEELFTLCPGEVQARFAELLGRLPLEADVHVLVAVRDDFLMRCHGHEGLAPVFAEPTPLAAPTGAALRRALVQPALACGYRFEDEALAEAMLREVEEERGALPLLAFAAARLWEERDRDQGLLTRAAYEAIGGVGGALARHAEATLESLEPSGEATVRELFRNLVTAEGTRAARDREELLSVFEDRAGAERVLQALIGARLLTSFEVPAAAGGEAPSRRVEVVHESLLRAWPRLVRWQTQDTDGAQLRDQLRQASRLWEERGRPADLLWTGTSYRELATWRERYPGRLSSGEERFAAATVEQAGRRRRRRRTLVAAGFAALVAAVGVIGGFWARAESARERADRAQTLEQARHLTALARLALGRSRTEAVAYALASLETADTEDARRFAVEAASGGPVARIAPVGLPNAFFAGFSPGGGFYAVGDHTHGLEEALHLLSRDGRRSERLATRAWGVPFFLDEDLMLVELGKHRAAQLRVGDGTRRLEDVTYENTLLARGRLYALDREAGGWRGRVWSAGPRGAESRPLEGPVRLPRDFTEEDYGVVAGGVLLLTAGDGVWVGSPDDWSRPLRLLGRQAGPLGKIDLSADGTLGLTVSRRTSELHLWSTAASAAADPRLRVIGETPVASLQPDGRLLATKTRQRIRLWDLERPESTRPVTVTHHRIPGPLLFDPTGRWVAAPEADRVLFFAVDRPFPAVFDVGPKHTWLAWDPSGDAVLHAGVEAGLRRIPVRGMRARTEAIEPRVVSPGLALRPGRRELFVRLLNRVESGSYLLDLETGRRRAFPEVRDAGSDFFASAFHPDGDRVATVPLLFSERVVRLVNVETGERRRLEPPPEGGGGKEGSNFRDLAFLPDGRLLTLQGNALRRWSLEDGRQELVRRGQWGLGSRVAALPGGREALVFGHRTAAPTTLEIVDLEHGSSRPLNAHGNQLRSAALDASGALLVTGGRDGVVRVGPVEGEPHLLYGHAGPVWQVAVSPDGTELASASEDGTLRIWPMPAGVPRHRLPHAELLARLRALTNVRVVEDPGSPGGYRTRLDPFPGWEETPVW